MSPIVSLVTLLLAMLSLSVLYQKYIEKQIRLNQSNPSYSTDLQQYMLTSHELDHVKKPLLWVHIPHEYNARQWESFGSRSSYELNQPYLYLTVQSIIKCCDESFKIVLIDDGSFANLIPHWTIDLTTVAEPIKGYLRQLAMAKLLWIYGGIQVPISFLCFRDLIHLYEKGTRHESMFVCEHRNPNITSTNQLFFPSAEFMGAPKQCPTMRQFIDYMETKISADYTAQIQFDGDFDSWCNDKVEKGRLCLISGTNVGTKTLEEEAVTVETLLGKDYIHFYVKTYGIWIPAQELLKRRHYEWFVHLSPEDILSSDFILAKYMVICLSPDSVRGVVEPMTNLNPVLVEQTDQHQEDQYRTDKRKDWISFWKVPLGNGTLNVFGTMPLGLGDNVPRRRNAG